MRIAVVGHGRSPEGRGWGPDIDACDLVVRMWDWHWQTPADHGTRFDYGMVALNAGQVAAWMKSSSEPPARGWLGFLRTGCKPVEGFETVDPARWDAMAFSLGARKCGTFNLTRGTAAACWAVERAGIGGEVVLVGFDNIALGRLLPVEEAFPPAYLAHYGKTYPGWERFSGYVAGADTCGSHDIAVERWLISTLGCENGVTVRAAGDQWPQ